MRFALVVLMIGLLHTMIQAVSLPWTDCQNGVCVLQGQTDGVLIMEGPDGTALCLINYCGQVVGPRQDVCYAQLVLADAGFGGSWSVHIRDCSDAGTDAGTDGGP